MLPGEVKEIESYLERGGNLLWLADPGPVARARSGGGDAGLEFLPGMIVDPASRTLTGNAAALVVATYGTHPIVRNFSSVTLFPRAGGIQVDKPEGWETAVVLDTREQALGRNRGAHRQAPLRQGPRHSRSAEPGGGVYAHRQ